LFRSERKSLIRFLIIYLTSTFILFALASWGFYTIGKQHIVEKQRARLYYRADRLLSEIRNLHQSDAKVLYYPDYGDVDSAIFDRDGRYIFGTFKHPVSLSTLRKCDDCLIIERKVEPYYLGAARLAVLKTFDTKPLEILQRDIALFMVVSGVFFAILGYFLGKLFIKPMRDAMEKLNRFIQDTAHELNTPVSTILTNIEMIEAFQGCPDAKEELKRIEIASKTLNRIYDDLSYINLNHRYHRKIEPIDMGALVRERLTYFSAMTEAKALRLRSDIRNDVIVRIDRNDALRLIDNILSNAVKYNRQGGKLEVRVTQNCFEAEDSGEGIAPEALEEIRKRFVRANESEGGFGIGLHIVDTVARYYGFELEIESHRNVGTKVRVIWRKK
jgi:two-component system OmpR family sensor kinase